MHGVCAQGVLLVTVGLVGAAGHGTPAPSGRSATLVKELVAALETAKLTSFVAEERPGSHRYIGVLLQPGTTLVAVSAIVKDPKSLATAIAAKRYRAAFFTLSGETVTPIATYQDYGVDGFTPKGIDGYLTPAGTITFDGDWRKQGLASARAYDQLFAKAEGEYAALLTELLAKIRSAKAPS